MGEVWKAEDTQLRRIVALKLLSSETVDDEEVKARLVRDPQEPDCIYSDGLLGAVLFQPRLRLQT